MRDAFSSEVTEKLGNSFDDKFGRYLTSLFEKFAPYEIHNRTVLELESQLEIHQDRKLRPILFEGQGIGRVFDEHRKNLRQKLKDNEFETDVPKIEALAKRLDDTAHRISESLEEFRYKRATRFLESVNDKGKLKQTTDVWQPKLVGFLDDLYDNVFTSVAFQAALICGFFGEIERCDKELRKLGDMAVDRGKTFAEYLCQLSNFFVPTSSAQIKKLVRLFVGKIDVDSNQRWSFVQSRQTFRSVVYRGEMQPDQWLKYKYLLLEIWRPTISRLAESVDKERQVCRRQVFESLYEHHLSEYAKDNVKVADSLSEHDRSEVFKDSYGLFRSFLQILGTSTDSIPGKEELKRALAGGYEDSQADEEDEEAWESTQC